MEKNDEKIGFHKGAISTLLKEREELVRIVTIIDKLLNAHVEELKSMGVDVTKQE